MDTLKVAVPAVVLLPARRTDVTGELGGKGAGLDRMLRTGLPVPATAVVTSAAYRRFTADRRIQAAIGQARSGSGSAAGIDAAFLAAPLEESLAEPIIDAARQIGAGGPIAVRSSAYAEDMAGLSFAGQYHSVLNVDSGDPVAVLRAVRLTWASLWHPAPHSYREAWGVSADEAAMAVVLMRMVDARMAGVTFTVDPGGRSGHMRVEAVTGLAEGLVSGTRRPHVWLLPRDPGIRVAADPMLPTRELAELSRRAEQMFGCPQDIEWAWDGEQIWLVQSRPITTTSGDGSDSAVDDAQLMSTGVDEMLPGVLPPLLWELNAFLVEEALRRVFDDVGADPVDRTQANVILRRVRGRAALNLDLFKTVAGVLPGGSEQELEREYFGRPVSDPGTKRDHRWAIRHDLRVFTARQRATTEAETVLVTAAELAVAQAVLTDLDDRALLAYRRRLIDVGARAMTAELAVATAAAAAYRHLERFLAKYLSSADAAAATQQLTAGAGLVNLPPVLPELSSRSVFAGPTWRETPAALPPAATPGWPDRAADRQRRAHTIEERLRRHPRWRRIRLATGQVIDVQRRNLRAAVNEATTGLERRERTKAAVLTVGGLVRAVHLELGHRLAARGLLEDPADVDLLRDSELGAAVLGHAPPRGTITRRRRWQSRYEDAGPLPERFTGVPHPEATRPMPPGRVLTGWAASGGRHTGRARVLDAPAAGVLGAGEVLVARTTDAAWTPVFLAAGAIVVERGGPLSHAAVLARELGIPAVLNVAGAAAHLDGRLVTVDGDRGDVVVHESVGGERR